MAEPVEDYVITAHAAFEMARRKIPDGAVRAVLAGPEQRFPVGPGRDVLQSRTERAGKVCLLRVFVDGDRHPVEVVTPYMTSKFAKYWRDAS